MSPPTPKLDISADPEALSERVAAWLLATAQATPASFAIALSGGTTPQRLYQRLAAVPYADRFPWQRTHVFWGDERFVPRGDPLSNFRMANEALLSRVPIPPDQIHPVPTGPNLDAGAAALAYEQELRGAYGAERSSAGRPLFDVVLLGLGPDGHTASLFPGSPELGERNRWVRAVTGARAEARITLTYPALENCGAAAFLVEGEGKRAILEQLLSGDGGIPAARLRPRGELLIFADTAAAGGMSP